MITGILTEGPLLLIAPEGIEMKQAAALEAEKQSS